MSGDPRHVGKPQAAKPAVPRDLSPRWRAAMGMAFKPADKIGYQAIGAAVTAAAILAIVGLLRPDDLQVRPSNRRFSFCAS